MTDPPSSPLALDGGADLSDEIAPPSESFASKAEAARDAFYERNPTPPGKPRGFPRVGTDQPTHCGIARESNGCGVEPHTLGDGSACLCTCDDCDDASVASGERAPSYVRSPDRPGRYVSAAAGAAWEALYGGAKNRLGGVGPVDPYTEHYAKELYGTKYPRPSQLLREAARVVRHGGRIGFVHYITPNPPAGCHVVKVFGLSTGFGYPMRAVTIYERDSAPLIGGGP